MKKRKKTSQVVAFDRYSRDTIIGEVLYELRDARLTLHPDTDLELPLQARPVDVAGERGEVREPG